MEVSGNTLQVEIVTTRRRDLFDFGRLLAQGMNDNNLLSDAEKPVNVYVGGTFSGGKKIFPDAVRAELLGPDGDCAFAGKKEYDEYWTHAGKSRQLSFINVAWEPGTFSDVIATGLDKDRLLEEFHSARTHGGVSFIHNKTEHINDGLHIYLEKLGGYGIEGWSIRSQKSKLSPAFAKAIDREFENGVELSDIWSRYVEITVIDKRLLESDSFMKAVEKLSHASKRVAKDLAKPAHRSNVQPLSTYLGGQKTSFFARGG